VGDHIVIIAHFATIGAIAITLTKAIFAICVLTRGFALIVRGNPIVAALTRYPTSFARTILTPDNGAPTGATPIFVRNLMLDTISIKDNFPTIGTDNLTGQLDTIDTDGFFVKTIGNRRMRIGSRIKITLTIRALKPVGPQPS
jgi:hypothetical protein